MYKSLIALAMTFFAAVPALASDKTDVMAAVNQFMDGFNKGDTKTALTACAAEAYIIDEFPPYEWHGAGACSHWADAYDANAKKNAITDGVVTLGEPLHVDVTADRAYVVVPADYAYKEEGKPAKETGARFTVALQKGQAGWRITAWTWTAP